MDLEKYRPSNGTEGMEFYSSWCETCCNDGGIDTDDGCEILTKTMVLDIEDEGYPNEWVYDEQGVPCCTRYDVPSDTHTARTRRMREEKGQLRLF